MIIKDDILFAVFDTDVKNGIFIAPETIKAIGSYAFERCTFLKKIIIHDNVMMIHSYAFYFCENIDEIKLPHNLKNLTTAVFIRENPGLAIIYDDS